MPSDFSFRPIDVIRDRETIIRFRKDSYFVSFGNEDAFGEEENYIAWMAMYVSLFPSGFVLMEQNGEAVGQVEVEIIGYEGHPIGYVDLFYLAPDYRDQGLGKIQLDYAEKFFRKYKVSEYHLRVSPTNKRAIHFYEKHGMELLMVEELQDTVLRMVKYI